MKVSSIMQIFQMPILASIAAALAVVIELGECRRSNSPSLARARIVNAGTNRRLQGLNLAILKYCMHFGGD